MERFPDMDELLDKLEETSLKSNRITKEIDSQDILKNSILNPEKKDVYNFNKQCFSKNESSKENQNFQDVSFLKFFTI